MEKQGNATSKNNETNQFYRFQVFHGNPAENNVKKTKSVGMAYLKEGQSIYTLRLWTFSQERFYVIANKNDSSKVLIMTREPNKNPGAKNRYFWNIVGSGQADSVHGVIKLEFDLLDKVIYMNLFPESSAYSANLPEPETANVAA